MWKIRTFYIFYQLVGVGCVCVGVAKVLDYDVVVSEFKLQSHYNVPFRTNTQEKGMKPLIPPGMGWIVPQLFFKDSFGIK